MEYRLISVIALKGGTGFPERSQHHANRMKKRTRPVNSRHFRPTSWCTPTGWKSVKRSGQKSTIRWVSLAKHHLSNILRSPSCELIYIERERSARRMCMYPCDWRLPVRDYIPVIFSWLIGEFPSEMLLIHFVRYVFIHRHFNWGAFLEKGELIKLRPMFRFSLIVEEVRGPLYLQTRAEI